MESVRVVMTKWGGGAHWEFEGVVLGADEHGSWLGFGRGTPHTRPGAAFVSEVDAVTLVPPAGDHLATFHSPGIWVDTYVDVTHGARLGPGLLSAVDLDLDVLRLADGSVVVDDEDEFADHRVRLRYPAAVVERAEATCAAVLEAVRDRRAPYDGTAARWLARLGTRPQSS